MLRKLTIASVAAWLLATQAIAEINIVKQHLPTAELVGEARMEYLFWSVYEAELYAPNGVWREGLPVALSLRYLRSLDGDAIARRSVSEIRDQGFSDETVLTRWYEQMRDIFPDVEKGTRITGVVDELEKTRFYRDGELIGEIDDALFGRSFFGIWLSEKTSQPTFRKRLLGLNIDKNQ